MPGLAADEKLVIVLLVGLTLTAGALLYWEGRGTALTLEGALPREGLQPAAGVGPGGGAALPGSDGAPGEAGAGGPSGEEAAAEPPAEVVVHVAGAVLRPGVYSLPEGSRVIDAVTAAGGVKASADPDAVNLARRVADGEQVYIPTRDETRASSAWPAVREAQNQAAGGPATGGKVNINTASQAELETLPGVGPSIARRIIEYRLQNGPFRALEELMNVSGIGEKRFAELVDLITIR
ncbi:MAG: helix-hairpin-helix domain-containing protein [Bacillota bacterium]